MLKGLFPQRGVFVVVVRKLRGGESVGVECGRDEVKPRVVHLRLEFGKVFYEDRNREWEEPEWLRDWGTRAEAASGPIVDWRKPRSGRTPQWCWGTSLAPCCQGFCTQTYGQLEPCAMVLLQRSKAMPWVWEDVLGEVTPELRWRQSLNPAGYRSLGCIILATGKLFMVRDPKSAASLRKGSEAATGSARGRGGATRVVEAGSCGLNCAWLRCRPAGLWSPGPRGLLLPPRPPRPGLPPRDSCSGLSAPRTRSSSPPKSSRYAWIVIATWGGGAAAGSGRVGLRRRGAGVGARLGGPSWGPGGEALLEGH